MTPPPRSDLRRFAPLGAILLLALGLRCWGLYHGLPFVMGRPDEPEALEKTVLFPQGDFNPRWFVYPNLFFWLIWIWEEVCLAVRRLVADVPAYDVLIRDHMALLIAQGRVLSALLGTATVGLVWWLGRRLAGQPVAWLAALLLATNFLHIRDSHALKADIPLTFGVPIVIWLLARYAEAPSRRRAIVAAVAIGVATALKYPGVLLLFPAWHATIIASPRSGWRRLLPNRTLIEIVLASAGVFLLCSPFLLIDTARLLATFTFSVKAVYGIRPQYVPKADAPLASGVIAYMATRTFWYHLAISLRHGCGLVMALLTPPAVLTGLLRRQGAFWRLSASFCLAYYLTISWSQVGLARYLTPLTPLLALLVARLLAAVAEWGTQPWQRAAILTLGTGLLIAEPLASTVAHNRIATQPDTRVQTTDWLAEHVPVGSVVARLGSVFFQIADPALPPGLKAADLPLGETDLDRFGISWVVVHDHSLSFSRPIVPQLRVLAPRLLLQAEFSPSAPGAGEDFPGGFEEEDAYFIPFWDFDGIIRPGPRVRIYRWAPAP